MTSHGVHRGQLLFFISSPGNHHHDRAQSLAFHARCIARSRTPARRDRQPDRRGRRLGDIRPIDMFPFLGARHGKAAVIEVIRQIAQNVRVHRFDRESIMLGVDSASSMLRFSLTRSAPTSRSRCGSRISRSSRPAGSAASACSSTASTWSNRRWGARSNCRGCRRSRDVPGLGHPGSAR